VKPSRAKLKKWLVPVLKLAVVLLVLWFVRGTLLAAWQEIGQEQWHFDWLWLTISGILYLAGLLPAALFWHRVLRVLGQNARLDQTLRAYYLSHLGKYVPGKAMVVVIRSGAICGGGVNVGVAAVSVFFETLTMMAVGSFLAAGIVALRVRDESLLFWLALGMMVASGVPTIPYVFRRLARLAGVGKSDPAVAENLAKLGFGTLVLGWVCMAAVWVMLALSLWAAFRAMGIEHLGPWEHLSGYVASVSLAMVAGFVALIPGGLGVREVVLLKLLIRLFDINAAEAAVASALLRLVWLVAELLISIMLYIGHLFRQNHALRRNSRF
jgi:glycosyltransferase 2 family protein